MFSDYVEKMLPAAKCCFASRIAKKTHCFSIRTIAIFNPRLKSPSVNLDKWCYSKTELCTIARVDGLRILMSCFLKLLYVKTIYRSQNPPSFQHSFSRAPSMPRVYTRITIIAQIYRSRRNVETA